jgi:hypothetical protein
MVRTPIEEAHFGVLERLDPALTPAEIRRRWAEGQEGHVWWLEGTPVHSYWSTRRPALLPYLGRTFQPAPGVGSIGFRHVLVARRHFAPGLVRLDADRGFSVLPVVPPSRG